VPLVHGIQGKGRGGQNLVNKSEGILESGQFALGVENDFSWAMYFPCLFWENATALLVSFIKFYLITLSWFLSQIV
jgi:hypothetical protein